MFDCRTNVLGHLQQVWWGGDVDSGRPLPDTCARAQGPRGLQPNEDTSLCPSSWGTWLQGLLHPHTPDPSAHHPLHRQETQAMSW